MPFRIASSSKPIAGLGSAAFGQPAAAGSFRFASRLVVCRFPNGKPIPWSREDIRRVARRLTPALGEGTESHARATPPASPLAPARQQLPAPLHREWRCRFLRRNPRRRIYAQRPEPPPPGRPMRPSSRYSLIISARIRLPPHRTQVIAFEAFLFICLSSERT